MIAVPIGPHIDTADLYDGTERQQHPVPAEPSRPGQRQCAEHEWTHHHSGGVRFVLERRQMQSHRQLDLDLISVDPRAPDPKIAAWLRPDIENRIKAGQIKAYFNSTVREITIDDVLLSTPEGDLRVPNDFVFAMTGYHPDFTFIRSLGVELAVSDCRPVCDLKTLESNVPGIYLAGVIVAGSHTNEIFIENGRHHGRLIADAISSKLKGL